MRIIFNMMNCGLGLNGGSQTVVLSANTLSRLGHEVYIIDSGRHKYTWDVIEVPHIIVRKNSDIPDSDAIIATGYGTVKSTIELPTRTGNKYIWIRGWELWKMSEKKIVSKILNTPLIKLVNSVGLQRKLASYDIKSQIIRPGNDFKNFRVLNKRQNNELIRLGGLYHKNHKTKNTDWIIKAIEILHSENKNISINLFGTDKFSPKKYFYDKYYQQPNKREKEKIYNHTDIWLSPTNLEGLHIVPQEAMLTECPVVGTLAPLSGMQDFLYHNVTGLVANINFESFLNNLRKLIYNTDLRRKLGIAARIKILELGSREDNMIKLVKYMEAQCLNLITK
jgi:glycosyltransferase involved in cell wall biosynthesis